MERMFRNDLEEPMVDSTIVMSVEDHRALTQMEDSVKIVDGHYQLGLPWKNNFTSLPNDRECALTRLNHLKKHFQHNPDLFERYKVTIKGHVSSGYARLVPHCELEVDEDTPVWFLHHHPVFHPQKLGKVRVVFNCADKYKGTSLSDQLLQGPDLTNWLVGVLIHFCQESIAMMADIEGMFHQV